MPYTVQQLLNELGKPVIADADEPIQDALDRMIRFQYSQLPVARKKGEECEYFLITHDTILRSLSVFNITLGECQLCVEDAMEKVSRTFTESDDLFDLIEYVNESACALIIDTDKTLTHIVTNDDITRLLRQWAIDIMYARDIEHILKQYITDAFQTKDGSINEEARQSVIDEVLSGNTRNARKQFENALLIYNERSQRVDEDGKPIRPSVDQIEHAFSIMREFQEKPKKFKDLTLDGYIKLFLHETCWERCKRVFKMDKDGVRFMLEGVRDTRNKLAHFREEEINAKQRQQLRFCADWLAEHKTAVKLAFEESILEKKPSMDL